MKLEKVGVKVIPDRTKLKKNKDTVVTPVVTDTIVTVPADTSAMKDTTAKADTTKK